MQDVNVNDVKGYPMLFLHITNKNTKKQRAYQPMKSMLTVGLHVYKEWNM